MAKRGRPNKYNKAEEMQKKIDEYFEMCDKKEKPYTITGLALALDMDRRSLLNYGNKDEFFLTIKKAKERVENYLEEHLLTTTTATGTIFNLKNNFGWKDKQEVEANVNQEIRVTLDD